ncbi:MAG: serine/threonine-protein kinase [Planctomycetota bacterium]
MGARDILAAVEHALDLHGEEREEYLASLVDQDAGFAARVREILALEVEEDFLDPPLIGSPGITARGLGGTDLGRFRLTEELALGGTGVVYRAQERETGEPAAIKILPPAKRVSPFLLERFRREWSMAGLVRHEHVLPVLDHEDDGNLAWYAMPLVQGHDLAEELRLQGQRASGVLWPPFGSVEYARTVVVQFAGMARALEALRSARITHRDLKPRNLLLGADGELLLIDFGLAHIPGDDYFGFNRSIQGTVRYMSPEQAGAIAQPIDQRSDLYSLAVVLYEALSLQPVFDEDRYEVLAPRLGQGIPIPLHERAPGLPPDLYAVVAKATRVRPGDRYRHAFELAAELERVLDSW